MPIRLSPRLRCIADYVLPGASVADVGTDHAYIPIWLLQSGICTNVIATDLRPGPLERAAADADACGVSDRLTLRLCDGLAGCAPAEADTIIIAGMGGETIMGILSASPWSWEKRLILQPQTRQAELRAWLAERGLAVLDASLAYDAGRIYLVWLAGKGQMRPCSACDPILLEKRDPLLRPYAEEQIKRLRKQIRGMESSERSEAALLARQKAALAEWMKILEEVKAWQA